MPLPHAVQSVALRQSVPQRPRQSRGEAATPQGTSRCTRSAGASPVRAGPRIARGRSLRRSWLRGGFDADAMAVAQHDAALLRLKKIERVYLAYGLRRGGDGDKAEFAGRRKDGVPIRRVERV